MAEREVEEMMFRQGYRVVIANGRSSHIQMGRTGQGMQLGFHFKGYSEVQPKELEEVGGGISHSETEEDQANYTLIGPSL